MRGLGFCSFCKFLIVTFYPTEGSPAPDLDDPFLQRLRLSVSQLDIEAGTCGNERQRASWKRVATQSWHASENVCLSGKLLPTVYLLGAPKAATTSLALDLTKGAGLKCAGGNKEFHFWYSHSVNAVTDDPHGEMYQNWLGGLPNCSDTERLVAGDFSPSNMRVVPVTRRRSSRSLLRINGGHSFLHSQERILLDMPLGDERELELESGHTSSLPQTLATIYGDLCSKITFVVMLREPLSRIHSHWFYVNVPDISFQSGVEAMMSRFGGELVWMSMYGQHMQEWVASFPPEQFYVIPYLAYGKGDTRTISMELSRRIKFDFTNDDGKSVHRNGNQHPGEPLDKLITEEFRSRFDAYMAEDKAKLIKVLAEGQPRGMGLAKYEGNGGNAEEIQAWLEKWW